MARPSVSKPSPKRVSTTKAGAQMEGQGLAMALLRVLASGRMTLRRDAVGQFHVSAIGAGLSHHLDAQLVDLLSRRGLIAFSGNGHAKVTAAARAALKASPMGNAHLMLADDGDGISIINLNESPLRWLATRGGGTGEPFLATHHVQAGERLRAEFMRASALPRMGINWDAAPAASSHGTGRLHLSESALAARERITKALGAVGTELSGVLVDVCGHGKGLELVEVERQWPVRTAKVVLRLALEALGRHYGYGDAARGRALSP